MISRRSGILVIVGGLVVAGGLASYGIWSRATSVSDLQKRADDAAIPKVQAISPKAGPAEQSLKLPGQVNAWNEAEVYAQVSGYVEYWNKDYGAHVNAGDVLATIATPELDTQYEASKAKLNVAQAQYNIAAITSKRYDALKGSDGVSVQQIDDRNATAEAAKAQVNAAQQDVENYAAKVAFKAIKAPFAGIVTARHVNVGDFIGANGADVTQQSTPQPLFTVDDVHDVRIFVSVPQTYGSVLKPGLTAKLYLPGNAAKTVPAKFLTMAGGVSAATRTIVTEFVVDNSKEELLPGAYVSVQMTFPSNPDIMIVPAQALLFGAGGTQVAVIGAGNKVHMQKVTVGETLGLTVQLISGLSLTDKIVASPSLGLLEGQQVEPVTPAAGSQPASQTPVASVTTPDTKPDTKPGTATGGPETLAASSGAQSGSNRHE
ncbi:efflux RND transporter periplasmic adaptor subunit [Acidisphaera sp. L21]|uniref:efflux RND transporter periplasmic adaptor subunit n=1 Tax=Acidisphaera sp. L21 TaxID=1641851 RepID=UPI00131CAD94|nr:efflux RND transporter periplasmic adaptor subunit [Acidisphaera sp. L21]